MDWSDRREIIVELQTRDLRNELAKELRSKSLANEIRAVADALSTTMTVVLMPTAIPGFIDFFKGWVSRRNIQPVVRVLPSGVVIEHGSDNIGDALHKALVLGPHGPGGDPDA